jgi:D-amino-acid dehydrogenase
MTAANAARPRRVTVIGAGIVGISAALFLQRDGHRVTVIDPREPGSGASFGNAGGLVFTSCAQLAMPGMLRKVPAMLRDPLGPLVVRWGYLPRIAPWLFELVWASRPARAEAISRSLTELNGRAAEPWRDLARQSGAQALLREVGWLKVYETDAGLAATAFERELMTRRSRRFELLNADELRQLEPGLAPVFRYGFFQPEAAFIADPAAAVAHLAADFLRRGGRIVRDEVSGFELSGRPRRVVSLSGGHEADAIVLAAGAWSRGLARQLGAKVRLDTERGYHLMLPVAEPGLRRPVVNGEEHFVLCPMEAGVRLTSQVEFAGLDAPPDYRRIRAMLPRAKRMLPGLVVEERSAWLGFRPSLPDSLPVIGPSPRHAEVVFAFGHGHLGLTQGPVTGRIVADLVAGRDPGLDLTPYRPGR